MKLVFGNGDIRITKVCSLRIGIFIIISIEGGLLMKKDSQFECLQIKINPDRTFKKLNFND